MLKPSALLSALPAPPDYTFDWAALSALPGLSRLFSAMAQTRQSPRWHGEGDVMAHTERVCRALCGLNAFRALPRERRDALSLAALLHDIGKISCTREENGEIVSPHHGSLGARMARQLLWTEFGFCGRRELQLFREAVCLLIRYHALPPYLFQKEDEPALALKIAANGELAPAFTLSALCLLGEADVLGRIAPDNEERLTQVALSREAALEKKCLNGPYPFPSPRTAHALFRGASVWPEQELFDPSWGEVILLCGLPGTGKDSWCKKHHPDLPMVSLDKWRLKLNVKPENDQGRVTQAAREQAREYLRARRPFIWNATSLTSLRAQQVSLFENYGARVRIVYLETEWQENLRRNAERSARVPEAVIGDMLFRLEPPQRFEAQAVEWDCI